MLAIIPMGAARSFYCRLSSIKTLPFFISLLGLNCTQVASASTYSAIYASIFKPQCVRCHSGAKPLGNIDLDSYNAVMAAQIVTPKDPLQSKLYLATFSAEMPPKGPSLTDEKLTLIYEWIKKGAPND